SGAGAMCGGVVIGVVVIDTPGFDRDLLTVVPATDVLDDQTARELLGVSGPLVSVELDPVLSRPAVSAGRLSPAQLLRADEEVIPFQGREAELGDLTAWCTAPEEFGAWLVGGAGGGGRRHVASREELGGGDGAGRRTVGLWVALLQHPRQHQPGAGHGHLARASSPARRGLRREPRRTGRPAAG